MTNEGKSLYCLKDVLADGKYNIQVENFKMKKNMPVAVLSGSYTYSAGETTLLALKSLDNMKVFGKASGGATTANERIAFNDGGVLYISQTGYMTVKGEMYSGNPILPDVETSSPLQDAIAWINDVSAK